MRVGGWLAGPGRWGDWLRLGEVLALSSITSKQALTSHPPTHPARLLQISMFGIIKLNGKHLPFAFLALDLLMNQDIWTDIMGILCGHV